MKTIRNYIFLFIVVLSTACAEYIEKPTPPGTVPVQPVFNSQSDFMPVSSSEKEMSSTPALSAQNFSGYGVWENKDQVENQNSSYILSSPNSIKHNFKAYYENIDKPRVIVFVNQIIDSQLSSWKTEDVGIIQYDISAKRNNRRKGDSHHKSNIKGNMQIYNKKNIIQYKQFSEKDADLFFGIAKPLQETGVVIIDRNMIMRQFSSKTDQGDISIQNIKTIEIKAINRYADILIEVISLDKELIDTKYDITASAKILKTGQLIAQATFDEALDNIKNIQKYDSSTKGFQEKKFTIQDAGELTALMLLKKINSVNPDTFLPWNDFQNNRHKNESDHLPLQNKI